MRSTSSSARPRWWPEQSAPGDGCLDMVTAVRCWEAMAPRGYMLLEHLPDAAYAGAVDNVRAIAAEAGVPILP